MPTYTYENLGPERFQQLCQALLTQEFPRVTCMPIGMADGGRDAVVSKRGIDTLVFQIKFRRQTPLASTTPQDMLEWLQQAIEQELPKIKKLISKGMKRYIILTNATSSSHYEVGTRDKMLKWLTERISVEVDVWWRDDLDRRIEPLWELKRVYGLIEPSGGGDSLLNAMVGGRLYANLPTATRNLTTRITAVQKFISSQFDRDAVIRFKEADLPRQPLLQSYLDIGAIPQLQPSELRRFAGYMRSLRRIPGDDKYSAYAYDGGPYYGRYNGFAAAGLLLQLAGTSEFKNIVVEGAPGQGKSTLAQYVCQVHRARLLGRDTHLRGIPKEYRSSPVLLPFRTDLRDLAAWLKGENPFRSDDPKLSSYARSVEGFLAAMVSDASGGSSFYVDDFDELVAGVPTLLVFDGLDEVAEIESRTRVVEQIAEFSARIQEVAQELRIVVTSRPSAFSASPRFPPERFSYLDLANLNERLIFDYTKTWAKTRGIDSKGTSELLKVLTEKLREPHIADLARNSMQLAILLWLLYQQADSLPDQRTALYEQYIKTFLDREAGKSKVIRLHRGIVLQLHAYLAWVLQARAESGGSQGNMGITEIKTLACEYLSALGYGEEDLKIVDELFEQMMDRVGVIVSRVQGSYEFEVQPLREYFAAYHLYDTARYSPAGKEASGTKADRFDALARNPYWQNVTRFYVGFFDKGELAYLVAQFEELFEHRYYGNLTYPRVLAANILSDRVFYQSPGMGQKLAAQVVARPIGWFALSTGDGGNRFSLPKDSGGAKIDALGKEILNVSCPTYASEVVKVLVSHCDRRELTDWWLSRLPQRADATWRLWLSVGVGLDVLAQLPDAVALRIFDAEEVDLLDYGYIFKGGLSRLGLSDPVVCSKLIEYIKSGMRPAYRQWNRENPFDMASLVLFDGPIDLAYDGDGKRLLAGDSSIPDAFAPMAAIIAEAARLGLGRLRSSAIVGRLIRKHLGFCWLLIRHSLLQYSIAGNPTLETDSTLPHDVIDYKNDEFSLIVGSAIKSRGNISWWLHQMEQTTSNEDIQLLFVLLVSYATEETISACLPLFSSRSSSWTVSSVAAVIETIRPLDSRRPRLNMTKIDLAGCDPLIRALVGMRGRMDQRIRVLDEASFEVADLRLKAPISEAIIRTCRSRMRHTGRWMGCKEIAERHADQLRMIQISVSPRQLYEPGGKDLEEVIGTQILENPSLYPADLIKMADGDGSRRLAAQATPIAITAMEDQWFDQPQPF